MSHLKLIKKKKESQKRDFRNTCPRKLESLPKEICPLAIPIKSKESKNLEEPKCDWWINSPNHNYCFWSFIEDRSEPDGSMKELFQSDLAKLFCWNSTQTQENVKIAMDELIEALKNHELTDELNLD